MGETHGWLNMKKCKVRQLKVALFLLTMTYMSES